MVSQLQAIHQRQHEVDHDKTELAVERAGDGQSFFAVSRCQNAVAFISQCLR